MTINNYSISTDFLSDKGCPEESLRLASEAGFTHIHWCHHWHTDFVYGKSEISQIKSWLKKYNLKLLDLHGSSGIEKKWYSLVEYQRLAGVELVKNRIDMTAELGGDAVVMHIPLWIKGEEELKNSFISVRKSLDELHAYAIDKNIKIAIENTPDNDFEIIISLLSDYPSDFLGYCYDSGHGNMGKAKGIENLMKVKNRLICLHLHDNDGITDQHKNPFSGTVDWKNLMSVIKKAGYKKPLNLEVGFQNMEIKSKKAFLKKSLNDLKDLLAI